MIVTRKIELYPVETPLINKDQTWHLLHKLNNMVYKAANTVVNNQHFLESFVEWIILMEPELKEEKLSIDSLRKEAANEKDDANKKSIYKEINSREKELTKKGREIARKYYDCTDQNTTYRMISALFPDIPSYIRGSLNKIIVANYQNEKLQVRRGERSVRTYRKGMAMPFMKSSLRFEVNEKEIYLNWINNTKFELIFGADKSNNRLILERALNNEYKLSDSSIQIKNKKIFLLLAVDLPDEKKILDENIIVGVDLGVTVPAYCALNEGLNRMAIGSKDDFLRVRVQMQSRRRRMQKALKMTKGGKGRPKKLKALDDLREKEKNFARTYNHMVSYLIVKFALNYNAATIHMEDLKGFSKSEDVEFILRNWSYYQLQEMVKYKAKKFGIKVLLVDPYHTSKACALCGSEEPEQRISQSQFICKNPVCKNFNIEVNADYNAALNIAKSNKFTKQSSED